MNLVAKFLENRCRDGGERVFEENKKTSSVSVL